MQPGVVQLSGAGRYGRAAAARGIVDGVASSQLRGRTSMRSPVARTIFGSVLILGLCVGFFFLEREVFHSSLWRSVLVPVASVVGSSIPVTIGLVRRRQARRDAAGVQAFAQGTTSTGKGGTSRW
jgi:hypothetical protein